LFLAHARPSRTGGRRSGERCLAELEIEARIVPVAGDARDQATLIRLQQERVRQIVVPALAADLEEILLLRSADHNFGRDVALIAED
jgi:hypothetical protein